MKTKLKKVISTCLAAIMLLSTAVVAPVTVTAAQTQAVSTGETSGGFEYYDYGDGTAEITGYTGSATELTIPSKLDGKKVTSIGFCAFEYCENLTSITIPDSVTSISDYAFAGCTSLTSIAIPNSVTSIGEFVFDFCTSLASITIPDSVTEIGYAAFRNCTSLTSITIPNSVTSIGDSAFFYCTSLTSVTIPNSVTEIGYGAFSDCTSLANIYVDSKNASYTSIDGVLFDKEVKTLVCCPAGKNSSSYSIPDSVTSIGYGAFWGCASLESITIPNSVTSIGDSAFFRCTSLASITIPDSVTEIGYGAFFVCTSLANIYVDSKNSSFTSMDGVLFDKEVKTLICYPIGKNSSSYSIPDSVTSIGDEAFSDCTSLASVTIPDSVTGIGSFAFSGCTSLTSITIPDSVIGIGDYAFENTAWYDNQPDGVVYVGKVLYTYKGEMPQNTTITVKDGTKSIRDSAFSDCTSLASVTIPDSVTGIGNGAFSGCTSLTSITIPDSVIGIGYAAFFDCTSLTSITIPASVKYIGDYAFGYYYDDEYNEVKIDGFKITGYKGTEAERYANDNGFEFISLGEAPTKDPEVLGDVNADGKVNINDATTIQKSAASLVTLTEKQNKAADVNGDGKVNVNDVTAIQRYVAGIDTGFKIGNKLL